MSDVITSVGLDDYLSANPASCRRLSSDDGRLLGVFFQPCILNNRLMFPVAPDLRCFRDGFGMFADAAYGMIGQAPSPVFRQALEQPSPHGKYFAMGASGNYYHWMMDFLPRLVLLSCVPDGAERRVIIDRQPTPWQAESLRLVMTGLGLDSIDLYVSPGEWTLYPDCFVPCPLRWQAPAIWAVVLNHTRHLLPKPQGVKRLFAMRTNAQYRVPANQGEVARALEERGFVSLDPGSLTFGEQVALFSDVDIVVGCHGAGLTNMLFAPRGAALLELRGGLLQPFFGQLAAALGLHYEDVPGADVVESNAAAPLRDYVVPIDALLERLNSLGVF